VTVGDPKRRALDLISFADGFQDAGHPELARRSRIVARDVLELDGLLAAERSVRVALQARIETLEAILLGRETETKISPHPPVLHR
jgi:hypothetical protein